MIIGKEDQAHPCKIVWQISCLALVPAENDRSLPLLRLIDICVSELHMVAVRGIDHDIVALRCPANQIAQIPDIRPFGLDFVLSAMFIALIFMQLKNNRQVAVIFISGLSAMLLKLAGVTHWNVIIATLIAATAGTLIEAAAPKAGES